MNWKQQSIYHLGCEVSLQCAQYPTFMKSYKKKCSDRTYHEFLFLKCYEIIIRLYHIDCIIIYCTRLTPDQRINTKYVKCEFSQDAMELQLCVRNSKVFFYEYHVKLVHLKFVSKITESISMTLNMRLISSTTANYSSINYVDIPCYKSIYFFNRFPKLEVN